MRTKPAASSQEAPRSLLSARRELRRAVHEWRKTDHRTNHATAKQRASQAVRRGRDSNAHRALNWSRGIASELLGLAALLVIGTAVLVLCGLITQAVQP